MTGHTDNSASEKDGAGETQEREKAINEFWKKIAYYYVRRPCSECPATDADDCGFWEGTCAASLRKKYESIAGIQQKNAKKMVLPAPVKQANGVDMKTCTVKQWLQKNQRRAGRVEGGRVVRIQPRKCNERCESKSRRE